MNGNLWVNVRSLLFLDGDIFLGSHKQDYGSMLNLMTVSMVRKKLFLAFDQGCFLARACHARPGDNLPHAWHQGCFLARACHARLPWQFDLFAFTTFTNLGGVF